jgi:hypothetical protein
MLRHCCSHSSFSVAVAEPIALKAATRQEALAATRQEALAAARQEARVAARQEARVAARVAARQEALQMPQRLPL